MSKIRIELLTQIKDRLNKRKCEILNHNYIQLKDYEIDLLESQAYDHYLFLMKDLRNIETEIGFIENLINREK